MASWFTIRNYWRSESILTLKSMWVAALINKFLSTFRRQGATEFGHTDRSWSTVFQSCGGCFVTISGESGSIWAAFLPRQLLVFIAKRLSQMLSLSLSSVVLIDRAVEAVVDYAYRRQLTVTEETAPRILLLGQNLNCSEIVQWCRGFICPR